jgi:hypothetical protein
MTELAVTMEQLIEAVKVLTGKFDTLQNEKVAKISEKVAVMDTNLSRIQSIVYGSAAAIAVQLLAALVAGLIWAIKK